jgi:Flp pilus assembly protein TadD
MKLKYIVLLCLGLISPPSLFANDLDSLSELISKGKSDEVISRVNQHIKKYPNDPELKFIHGAILDHFGKTREAKEVFLLLSNKYPKNHIIKNNLGVIYIKLGEYFNARICFESALRLKTDYQEAKLNLQAIQRKHTLFIASK